MSLKCGPWKPNLSPSPSIWGVLESGVEERARVDLKYVPVPWGLPTWSKCPVSLDWNGGEARRDR